MDYRYETKEEARGFHKERTAFIILNGVVNYLPAGSKMSHFEYCESIGIDKEEFNKITRGYYLNPNLVFYKDNFIYDEDLIKEALSHINEIANTLNINEFDVYFGHIPEQNFALDLYYGKYKEGSISRVRK